MKIKEFLLIFLLSITFIQCTKNKNNSLSAFDLKGKVKSISKSTFLSEFKFGEATKLSKVCDGDGYHDRCNKLEFNKDGYLTKWERIYNDSKLNTISITEYNSKNQIVKENLEKEGEKTEKKYKYKYKDGEIIEKEVFDYKGELIKKVKHTYKKTSYLPLILTI